MLVTSRKQLLKHFIKGLLVYGRLVNAEAKATSVINNYGYSLLVEIYIQLNLLMDCLEAIFEMIYNTTDNTGSNHIGGMYKVTGYGDYLPSNDWYALMEDGDIVEQ